MSLAKAFLALPVLLALSANAVQAERTVHGASAGPVRTLSSARTTPIPPSPSEAAATGLEPFHLLPGAAEGLYAARLVTLIQQVADDRALLALCRLGFPGCTVAARRFEAVIEGARAKEGRARIGLVNRAINLAITYTSDQVQHGQADVWSSPLATFETGMGDCEDYAIAKYVALLELGLAAADLRLVVVRRGGPESHAVLAARLGPDWLILDNRTFMLLADGDLGRYAALASLRLDASPAASPVLSGNKKGRREAGLSGGNGSADQRSTTTLVPTFTRL